MAALSFDIKQNDVLPFLTGAITDTEGQPYPLDSVSSIDFFMRPSGMATPVVQVSATITNASLGLIAQCWASGQTATVGAFQAEFQLNYNASLIQTVPRSNYIGIRVLDDIA